MSYVTISRDVFEAMKERLAKDEQIFQHYGLLHEGKHTIDGHLKATRNFDYASQVHRVLHMAINAAMPSHERPVMSAMDLGIETLASRNETPVAFVMTTNVAQILLKEWRETRVNPQLGWTLEALKQCRYQDCTIFIVPDHGSAALVCCAETSQILKAAKRHSELERLLAHLAA